MANTILFVFEGEKTERKLLQSFQRLYFNEPGYSLITATFGTAIYSLYEVLKNDEFLDVVEILRDRSIANKVALEGILRDDISEIYLFFDHDGHTNNANDEKLRELLEHFSEETDHGRLYVSYPMVEAVKHLNSCISFQDVSALIENNQSYKGTVREECDLALVHLHELDQACWQRINHQHLMKAWDLVANEFCLPSDLVPQMNLFASQLEKHIEASQQVSVLSAFPLLLLDYYGIEKLDFLIGIEQV